MNVLNSCIFSNHHGMGPVDYKLIEECKKVYEEHTDDIEVKSLYASLYATALSRQYYRSNDREKKKCITRLKKLHEENPGNNNVLVTYASCLNCYCKRSTIEEKLKCVAELKQLYEENKMHEGVVFHYMHARYLTFCKDDLGEWYQYFDELKKTFEKLPMDQLTKNGYIYLLLNVCYIDNIGVMNEAIDELIKNSETAFTQLVFELYNKLSRDTNRSRKLFKIIKKIYERYPEDKKRTYNYAQSLLWQMDIADDMDIALKCVAEWMKIYTENTNDIDIACMYQKGTSYRCAEKLWKKYSKYF